MSKHPPEPWTVDYEDDGRPRAIRDADGEFLTFVTANRLPDDSAKDPEAEAAIARIVACVNACTGIDDPAALDLCGN